CTRHAPRAAGSAAASTRSTAAAGHRLRPRCPSSGTSSKVSSMNVAAIVMEILRTSGVRYLFGNPGTTELSFLDALPDSGLEYIVALQEATAMAAADGYAQASGQVGVGTLHVLPAVAHGAS